MSIYLVSKRLDKLQFMGTAAWFFFFMNVSKIPFYSVLGMITPATLRFNLLLVPAVLVGVVSGASSSAWSRNDCSIAWCWCLPPWRPCG